MSSLDPDSLIYAALRAAVETANAGKWPLVVAGEVTSPEGEYVTFMVIKNSPQRILLKNAKRHLRTGSVALNFLSPLGQTPEYYMAAAGVVGGWLPEGAVFPIEGSFVTITNVAEIQAGYRDDGYWNTPVLINWRCFA